MCLIKVSNLVKSFPGPSEDLLILNNLNLDINSGETVSITGESGSGKSTLLHLIAGLDDPTSGEIWCNDDCINDLTEEQLSLFRRKSLGLVFQFHFLLKEFTVLENTFLPGWIAGNNKTVMETKAQHLLELVGMQERLHHFPNQLSGGERQRVALARALINDPAIILADEPTGNLDEKNGRIVEDLILSLTQDFSKTLVLITHDKRFAQRTHTTYQLTKGNLSKI